ncbi:hypothetical protein LTS10_002658 [Elasticomyces elasticus]|nr:hypothetical protein LTS10_002658 [Elasticomyces elasticus]
MSIGDEGEVSANVPVLIVGGGPTGLLTAFMLSALGVRSLVIEKYPERLAAPKAHALNPRSLEICRQFGLDTNEIRRLGTLRHEAYWVNFLTNLSGELIGRLPYERMDAAVLDDTPEMIHNVPQPHFEAYIAERLRHDPNVEIQKGVGFVLCKQQPNKVTTTVEERTTKARWDIASRYVLACDGAKSQVRQNLGVETEGEDGYESMMTIHFSADLRPVVGERNGMLHWVMDPACSGFIICYDVRGNQVLISNFDSARHPADTWTEGLARDTVAAAIGQDIPIEVLSYRPWVLSRKVAKNYQSGNVFLVGDAAHSFPPTGGLGLNSGLADAHNIACRIAAVQNGWAHPSSLGKYNTERRPIALVNASQSIKNGKKIFSFLKAVGTAEIDDIDVARRNMLESVHNPAKQALIAEHIEAQREHFDNLGIHIGYVYGNDAPPANASDFTAKFTPGARLPHAWIRSLLSSDALPHGPLDTSYVGEYSATDVAARQWSTLDLVSPGTFTIIAGQRHIWLRRFEELQKALMPWALLLRLWTADTDFEFTQSSHRTLFEKDAGFTSGAALLVRPDQHLLGCMSDSTTVREMVELILRETGLAQGGRQR